MSVTFAIFKEKPETFEDGQIKESIESYNENGELNYIECARSSSGWMRWLNGFEIISQFLPDDTFFRIKKHRRH
jgi:hypothetical protein